MGVDIGIIGLPKSGRTTIFNTLTKGQAEIGSYSREAASAHVGIAKVPDARIDVLVEMFQPKKVIYAEVRYIDIGASVKDLAEGKGIGGELLNQLSSVDALIHVVRDFNNESVPHVEGSLDVGRDISTMNLELAFSDLTIMERRLERIEASLKAAKQSERQVIMREQVLLEKIKAGLENDIPLREQDLSTDEVKVINNYQFLTAKPILVVVNIGEDKLADSCSLEAKLRGEYICPQSNIATICGELEMELCQLENDAAKEFCEGFGIEEPGLERVIRLSYELLGLISFFTVGADENKAWSIKCGTPAVKAAGKIHSDIEKGFIRAEVVGYDDLINCGGLAEARKKGQLRLEGKTYQVQDGDVINFLFNI